MHSRSRSGGQSLILFLAFAAAMIGILLVAFNSGQVTNAKMRAMNAADAAAFSGAQWQARNLNFQAYMNRAMVVNEVTIAQSVSIRSWVAYIENLVENLSYISMLYPPAYAVMGRIETIIDRIEEGIQEVLPVAEYALRQLTNAEHGAQEVFNGAVLLAGPDLARNVAQANGAKLSTAGIALVGASVLQWSQFTESYNPGARNMGSRDRRARLREVILKSRDGFVQERDWRFRMWPLFELRKQGGTDLIDYDTWKGLDSLEFRTDWNFVKSRWDTKIPIGWGGAQAYAPQKQTGRGTHGNINEWGDRDGRLAIGVSNDNDHAAALPQRLPGYRDLTAAQLAKATPRLPFTVEVVIDDVQTSGSPGMRAKAATLRGEALDMDPQAAPVGGKGVYAMAAACIAFERPWHRINGVEAGLRQDRLVEKPSLFNPYWRASMATPSNEASGAAAVAKGLPRISSFFGRNGSCEN
jgi:Putative Flp pilus-assembly TadE/G-like